MLYSKRWVKVKEYRVAVLYNIEKIENKCVL